MFFEIMPVRRLHRAVTRGVRAHRCSAGAIRALLVRRGILIDKHALGHQIGEFLVAIVAYEQRLPAVADEDERIVWDNGFLHVCVQTFQVIRMPNTGRLIAGNAPNPHISLMARLRFRHPNPFACGL
jgi:hypothetical protein